MDAMTRTTSCNTLSQLTPASQAGCHITMKNSQHGTLTNTTTTILTMQLTQRNYHLQGQCRTDGGKTAETFFFSIFLFFQFGVCCFRLEMRRISSPTKDNFNASLSSANANDMTTTSANHKGWRRIASLALELLIFPCEPILTHLPLPPAFQPPNVVAQVCSILILFLITNNFYWLMWSCVDSVKWANVISFSTRLY